MTSQTIKKTNNWSDLSPLRQWIISNKFWLKAGTIGRSEKSTHFLLDGGCIEIPNSHYGQFLELLSRDLTNGWKWYLCEKRTPVFKFMSDLDIFEEEEISLCSVVRLVKSIQECMLDNCGDYQVVGCTTDSKVTTAANGQEVIKTGVHLIWPKLWVTQKTALWIRSKIVQHLTVEHGKRQEWNSWEDVVDECVYTANGLRMVGCSKCHPCKGCKGRNPARENCELCEGTGKKDEGRIYRPEFVLNGDSSECGETLKVLKKDIKVTLETTSIRNFYDLEQSPIKEAGDLELWTSDEKNSTLKTGKSLNVKVLDLDNPQYKKMQWCVKNVLPKCYKKSNIVKIKKINDGLYNVELDTNHCTNVDRCHTSSGIYLEFTPEGVTQRCWCRKDTLEGRRWGRCRDYRSERWQFSSIARNVIFPYLKTKKGKSKKGDDSTKSKVSYGTDTLDKLTRQIDYLENKILKNSQ